MNDFWMFENSMCYVTGQWCSETDSFEQCMPRHLQLIEYGKVASDIAHFWRMVTGMFLLNG